MGALFFFSCGKNNKERTAKAPAPKKVEEQVVDPVLKKGATLYKSFCMACHMGNGKGAPGMNPPLTKNKFTSGDKAKFIEIVILGMDEEIEIDGIPYTNAMTPFGFLTDEEIASVVTYVRRSFGNDSDAATIEEVAAVRASLPVSE